MSTAKILTLNKWYPVVYDSNGLIDAHEHGYHEYEHGALLPSSDWKRLNTNALSEIFDAGKHGLENNVLIDFLPQDALDALSFFDIGSCDTREEVLKMYQNRADIFSQFTDSLDDFLASELLNTSENLKYHTISMQPPGNKSVNYNIIGESKIYTGMHIDRSEGFPLGECYKSKQRMCINLGETRYLYIFDLSVDALKASYEKEYNKELTFETLIPVYGNLYKNYPVKVVEMPFGSYYIAPTDNLIHDASTINHTTFDVTVHYLANFKLTTNEIYVHS
jgi:hypothetical protein